MIDENEVNLWISRLETEESSWPNYQKLAALYIIQNQNAPKEPERPMLYSAAPAPVKTYASETVGSYGDSDFCAQWQMFHRTRRGRSWTS